MPALVSMPDLVSGSFLRLSLTLVKVNGILALISKGDELVAGYTLMGKGQEKILVKEGGIKRSASCLIHPFNACG